MPDRKPTNHAKMMVEGTASPGEANKISSQAIKVVDAFRYVE